MRRAERPCADKSAAGIEHTGKAVNLRRCQSFFEGQRRQDGRHALASMVLPEPGGPIISRLWPPAAATAIARMAVCCPRTSQKSTVNRPNQARVRVDFQRLHPVARVERVHDIH